VHEYTADPGRNPEWAIIGWEQTRVETIKYDWLVARANERAFIRRHAVPSASKRLSLVVQTTSVLMDLLDDPLPAAASSDGNLLSDYQVWTASWFDGNEIRQTEL